ncbi:MAG: sulfurtransferase [Pseudomonadota bacterium]
MTADPLISAGCLSANINAPNIRVLDATWVPPFLKDRPNGRACYEERHIQGAQYFDIDQIADQDTQLSHMLPTPRLFADQVGALGIGNDTHVIVYDSNGFFASARAWWMFRTMGHQLVHVLDGGLDAWIAAGGTTDAGIAMPEARSFEASFNLGLVRGQESMRAHIDAQDTKILDARDTGRFNGTSPEPRAGLPSGHMPGSFCVPASALIMPDKRLKSADQLNPILEDFIAAPVVTSCGSGVSAAVIALALARLGNWDAAVYDGSWSEWASNTENPIATTL